MLPSRGLVELSDVGDQWRIYPSVADAVDATLANNPPRSVLVDASFQERRNWPPYQKGLIAAVKRNNKKQQLRNRFLAVVTVAPKHPSKQVPSEPVLAGNIGV